MQKIIDIRQLYAIDVKLATFAIQVNNNQFVKKSIKCHYQKYVLQLSRSLT
jgi:hypothetical protein